MKTFSKKNLFLWIIVLFSFKSIYSQTLPGDIAHLLRIEEGLKAPIQMAIDQDDNIFVTDTREKQILIYSSTGELLDTINPENSPLSIAINKNNEVFYGDIETGSIFRLEADGSKTEFYSGTQYPNSMVFDADGLLYVVDSELKKVIVLDLSANVIQTIGEGTLIFPTGIAYNQNNRTLLVAEHGGLGTGFNPVVKVWMFDLDGSISGSFGSHGNKEGEFYRIQGLSVGRCGNIYVTDPYQGQVNIFDQDGSYITRFGEFGDSSGQLNVPMDILFNSKDEILVSSMNNGAVEVFNIIDTLPSARIESQNYSICQNETFEIDVLFTGTAPWSFNYTVNGVDTTHVNNIVDNPYSLPISKSGTYEIISISDAKYVGSCLTGNTSISINSEPPSSNISSGDITICKGESTNIIIEFTGISPWTFSYTIDGLNLKSITTTNNPYLLNVSEAGLYEVVSLEGGGCLASILTGSTNISVNVLPTSEISIGNATVPICQGEDTELIIKLTGSAPWSITYTNDDSNPKTINDIVENQYHLSVSDQGTYEVKLVTDNNCNNTNSIGYPDILVREPPLPGFDFNSNSLEINFINTSLNSDSYYWDFGDGNTSNETNPIHFYQESGEYNVTLTSYNENCGEVAFSDTLRVLQLDAETIKLKDIVRLYPNPTSGILTIEINKSFQKDIQVEILNVHGQKIYSRHFWSEGIKEHIDLKPFPKGVYIVRVVSDNLIRSGKLILSK
ncbi:MAG: PKD domain-containing protein [Bacteroidales bacterium]|nr:PKD domain-containing protein [Bacteroidales bacterium]